jgi:alkylation response protein AidB-like acyl-CoA dehydrogenase
MYIGCYDCLSNYLEQVLQEHSRRGYTAVAINPAAVSRYLGDITLPGGIKPEEWDGFHDLICIDEIARCGFLGVIWALGCGDSIGCPPVVNFGSEVQKQKFLPSVIKGHSRFCLGITEPDGEFSSCWSTKGLAKNLIALLSKFK